MSKDSVCLLPLISSCRASKALCTSKSPKRFFQKHLPGKRLNILRSQVGRYCQLLTLRQRVRRQLTNWEFPLWRARSDRALSSSGGGSITIRGKREKRQALNSRPFHLDGRANFLGDTAFRLLRSLPRQTPRGRFTAGDTVPLGPADRLIKGRDRRRKPEAAVAQVTEEARKQSRHAYPAESRKQSDRTATKNRQSHLEPLSPELLGVTAQHLGKPQGLKIQMYIKEGLENEYT